MPAASPSGLVNALVDAFQQSGAAVFFVSERVQSHPRRFVVERGDRSFSIWVYVWTLTHGGRPSLPDEYRIQMTSVVSPLPLNPNGHTALLGYHPDLQVFAGFDLSKHRTFTTGSPSVQIDISALHGALQSGLSFHRKENDEIAVGVRSDQLLAYVLSSRHLHEFGPEAEVKRLLDQAVESTTPSPAVTNELNASIATLSAERKRIVREISRLSRNANFRKSVLNAYDNRCAVTRSQMRLVEAAHILPVPVENSSDHVSNGLALSPTLHRAYDNCLIYLDTDLVMKLNEQRAEQLVSDHLHAGLDALRPLLNKRIHLPLDVNQHPNREFIVKANSYRRIPGNWTG